MYELPFAATHRRADAAMHAPASRYSAGMAEFFKTSTLWVVDFRYEGRPRRWFRAFAPGVDVRAEMARELHALHGGLARLGEVRPATDDEERQHLRGEAPPNVYCPTGR
ncbi:MAG: hypothetical protein OEY03_09245 [Rhizobacter sp.]|nr:hypothetical protein [Rhizobacter sp.]